MGSGMSRDEAASARRRVAGSTPLPVASPAQPLAGSAGLTTFLRHRLQRAFIRQKLGHDVLQLPILLLQLPRPPRLAHFQPAVTSLSHRYKLPRVMLCHRHSSPGSAPASNSFRMAMDSFFAESTLNHDSSSGAGGPSQNGEVTFHSDQFGGADQRRCGSNQGRPKMKYRILSVPKGYELRLSITRPNIPLPLEVLNAHRTTT